MKPLILERGTTGLWQGCREKGNKFRQKDNNPGEVVVFLQQSAPAEEEFYVSRVIQALKATTMRSA